MEQTKLNFDLQNLSFVKGSMRKLVDENKDDISTKVQFIHSADCSYLPIGAFTLPNWTDRESDSGLETNYDSAETQIMGPPPSQDKSGIIGLPVRGHPDLPIFYRRIWPSV